MLVLSRRTQESVHLGDSIVVRILSVKGDRVQLGFSAPREVGIWRAELTTPPAVEAKAEGTTARSELDCVDPPPKKRSLKLDPLAVSAHRRAS